MVVALFAILAFGLIAAAPDEESSPDMLQRREDMLQRRDMWLGDFDSELRAILARGRELRRPSSAQRLLLRLI